MRRFTPEPLRCFKCQAFGHVQKHCRAVELCAVCSGRHPTSECISALRSGERPAARCPNCGMGHHAWSKLCPERLRRLPPSSKDGRAGQRENVDARPIPAAPRVGRHEACQSQQTLAFPAPATTAARSSPEPPASRRRRRRSKTADSTEAVPETTKPTTAEASVQTDPPPQTKDVGSSVFPHTRSRKTQASPATSTCEAGTQTTSDDDIDAGWDEAPAPFPALSPERIAKAQRRRRR